MYQDDHRYRLLFEYQRDPYILEHLLVYSHGLIIGLHKERIDAFAGDAPQNDDITMLCLRYNSGSI